MKTGWYILVSFIAIAIAAFMVASSPWPMTSGQQVSLSDAESSGAQTAEAVPEFEHAADQEAARKALISGDIQPYSKLRKAMEQALEGKLVGERLRLTNEGWVYEVRARQEHGRMVFAVFSAKDGRLLRRMEGEYAPVDR